MLDAAAELEARARLYCCMQYARSSSSSVWFTCLDRHARAVEALTKQHAAPTQAVVRGRKLKLHSSSRQPGQQRVYNGVGE
jgi:hypothetical protein